MGKVVFLGEGTRNVGGNGTEGRERERDDKTYKSQNGHAEPDGGVQQIQRVDGSRIGGADAQVPREVAGAQGLYQSAGARVPPQAVLPGGVRAVGVDEQHVGHGDGEEYGVDE